MIDMSEIISVLKLNVGHKAHGKIKQKQRVDVMCHRCKNVKSVMYDAHIKNRKKSKNEHYICTSCCGHDKIIEYNKSQRGKSLEDRLGVEKAKQVKQKIGKFSRDNHSSKCLEKFYKMNWDEKYGKERADRMREHAKTHNNLVPKYGKDNPQFGKPAHKKSGRGISGYYKGYFFRSLLEASFIHHMVTSNIKFENGEKRKYAIPYIFDGRNRNYFCDFVIDGDYYEIKPSKLLTYPQNIEKFKYAETHCNNKGVSFFVKTEKDFNILPKKELDFLVKDGLISLL